MFAHNQRRMNLTTPLGADKLIVQAFHGREAISELFSYRVDAMWQDQTTLGFADLLGKTVTLSLGSEQGVRYFCGLVRGITQGVREEVFTQYKLDIVPLAWPLSRISQSRIFQQKSVPDILKTVFAGLDVDYQLGGTYEPREYCVQYRESDFDFACRLMEDEGIFYFFRHGDGTNTLVLGDRSQVFTALPVQPEIIYEEVTGGLREEDRIQMWEKVQELRSGKSTLWDHTFQMPGKNCETEKPIQTTLQVGTVAHKLQTNDNQKWELYEYPGGYAKRFDGIDKSGGEQAAELQKIFTDNSRTVGIRMQQEALPGLIISGQSNHAGLIAGFNFHLQGHFTDDDDYTLVSVHHDARQPLVADDNSEPFAYENSFTAIPKAMPFRPARITPIPFVHGVQTAIVVGPSGEEIFTDKYGRVKVQFYWDRAGQLDSNSSCWLRVATVWAQQQWGAVHIPRINQEVIVSFLEGDPDQPIIVGAVYNSDNMPPYTLPDNKTQSGIKSRSSKGGGAANFNEIRFEDKMGSEDLFMHAEKDMHLEVENDRATDIGHDETRHVKHDRTTNVDNDETKTVKGKETITITGDQSRKISQGNQTLKIDMGNQTNTLSMGNISTKCDLGAVTIEAMQSITLKVGQSSIVIDQMGVTVKGMMIAVKADVQLTEESVITQSTASAMMKIQGAITLIN